MTQRAQQRRVASLLPPLPEVTEWIPKNNDRTRTCPNCKQKFQSQGITKHAKSRAKKWCMQNGISFN